LVQRECSARLHQLAVAVAVVQVAVPPQMVAPEAVPIRLAASRLAVLVAQHQVVLAQQV
jgi:hypothetical protein